MSAGTLPLEGYRILVVEDEYFIADEVARSLRSNGAEVVGPCPTADRANQLLMGEGAGLHAAVLDMNLAGQTSDALIRQLMAQHIPVVLATGYDVAAIPPDLRRLPRCEKPFNMSALVTTLAALMRN